MRQIALIAIMLIGSPVLVYADSCNYEKDIEFTVDAARAQNLLVDVGAGELVIRGDASSSEIVVSAQACASSRNRLDDLDLRHRLRGSDIEIYTEFYQNRRLFSWWGSGRSRIDIEMTVPSELALRVDDGSGAVTINGVAALDLNDGSGSIRISDIVGDVYINDGSGSIEVSNVSGLVAVEDGSGDMRIVESNAVHIIDDGSGGIRIADITQNVYIDDDGSGGIDVRNVGGDVEIEDHGSGGVNVDNVGGNYYLDSGG
ncbi:MAG: hypothetical protein QGG54_07215 [Gammaproteobacteria bacterium]|nr:hypothetical protein [Gammaproteobacteria bacterium]MDP6536849.1 hypothetical protein [Gammaproteobacteria bacterium]MDP6731427.1 hypothetical protein [Gammaproteobacteria bacterium]